MTERAGSVAKQCGHCGAEYVPGHPRFCAACIQAADDLCDPPPTERAERDAIARDVMGKANWRWEPDLECHVPCCAQGSGYGTRCGNGPLDDDAIKTGDCGEH